MAETTKKENGFVRFIKRAGKFFKDCKGEIKKIVWPTPKTVFKNVGVVLVTIIVLALCIFLLDTVFMNLLGLVMEGAGKAAQRKRGDIKAEATKCRTKQNGTLFIPIPGMKTRSRQTWRRRWKTISFRI